LILLIYIVKKVISN